MNLNAVLSGYPGVLFSSDGDSVFSHLRVALKGMSSAKEAKLLNYACRFLEDKEYYLEIGTYTGYTLCSAGYESGGIFVGIDNFSESYSKELEKREDIKNELASNLKKYVSEHLILGGDFREFDMNAIMRPEWKIGVFYVDGKHVYDDVVQAVKKFQPHFSKEMLLMFDDTNIPEVRSAIIDILKDDRFEEIFYAKSFPGGERYDGMRGDSHVHRGFSVVTYRGKE